MSASIRITERSSPYRTVARINPGDRQFIDVDMHMRGGSVCAGVVPFLDVASTKPFVTVKLDATDADNTRCEVTCYLDAGEIGKLRALAEALLEQVAEAERVIALDALHAEALERNRALQAMAAALDFGPLAGAEVAPRECTGISGEVA